MGRSGVFLEARRRASQRRLTDVRSVAASGEVHDTDSPLLYITARSIGAPVLLFAKVSGTNNR